MLCHSAIFSTPPPQTVSLSLFISFLWVFFSGKCFLSKTNQVTNKPQLCIQLRFPPSQDSDDDGSVHLGEVLASQTAARAPPGAPANAVPGPLGRSGGLKQAVVGIVGLEDVLFNRFFQAFFFFLGKFHNLKLFGKLFFRLTNFIKWVETPCSVTSSGCWISTCLVAFRKFHVRC